MTEETFARPKHPDALDETISAEDAEAQRVGGVWALLAKTKLLNHDMIVRTEHTDENYVWVIGRTTKDAVDKLLGQGGGG